MIEDNFFCRGNSKSAAGSIWDAKRPDCTDGTVGWHLQRASKSNGSSNFRQSKARSQHTCPVHAHIVRDQGPSGIAHSFMSTHRYLDSTGCCTNQLVCLLVQLGTLDETVLKSSKRVYAYVLRFCTLYRKVRTCKCYFARSHDLRSSGNGWEVVSHVTPCRNVRVPVFSVTRVMEAFAASSLISA